MEEYSFSEMNKDLMDKRYDSIKRALMKKKMKIKTADIKRYNENYSIDILNNYQLDELEKTIERGLMDIIGKQLTKEDVSNRRFELEKIRKIDITEGGEISDNIFPIIRLGITSNGFRRMRNKSKEDFVRTDLKEVDVTNTIPSIIYYIMNHDFVSREYYSKFTEPERLDFEKLLLCLMVRTITTVEKERLKSYFMRDRVTADFYFEMESMVETKAREVRHPNLLNLDIFEDRTEIVDDEFSIMFLYLKSYLLPIMLELLYQVEDMASTSKKRKALIRSVSSYRVIIEEDFGAHYIPVLWLGGTRSIHPKVTLLNNNHRTPDGKIIDVTGYNLSKISTTGYPEELLNKAVKENSNIPMIDITELFEEE